MSTKTIPMNFEDLPLESNSDFNHTGNMPAIPDLSDNQIIQVLYGKEYLLNRRSSSCRSMSRGIDRGFRIRSDDSLQLSS